MFRSLFYSNPSHDPLADGIVIAWAILSERKRFTSAHWPISDPTNNQRGHGSSHISAQRTMDKRITSDDEGQCSDGGSRGDIWTW
ncbi:hypothetical protein DTO212C5_3676 [Paecilomyces variotii]|nr:hypothetical protein DTO212C5_3676 [Paecilomyces variotii]